MTITQFAAAHPASPQITVHDSTPVTSVTAVAGQSPATSVSISQGALTRSAQSDAAKKLVQGGSDPDGLTDKQRLIVRLLELVTHQTINITSAQDFKYGSTQTYSPVTSSSIISAGAFSNGQTAASVVSSLKDAQSQLLSRLKSSGM